MSDPYSKRLGTANTAVAGTVIVGTCPAAKRWIIRSIRWTQTDVGTCRGQLSISGFTNSIDYTPALAQNDVRQQEQCHVVVNAGEQITMTPRSPVGAYNLRIMVSGYELDA